MKFEAKQSDILNWKWEHWSDREPGVFAEYRQLVVFVSWDSRRACEGDKPVDWWIEHGTKVMDNGAEYHWSDACNRAIERAVEIVHGR